MPVVSASTAATCSGVRSRRRARRPPQLAGADRLGVRAQLGDVRARPRASAATRPSDRPLRSPAPRRGRARPGAWRVERAFALQVVQVDQRAPAACRTRGIDVSRQGDVEQHQRQRFWRARARRTSTMASSTTGSRDAVAPTTRTASTSARGSASSESISTAGRKMTEEALGVRRGAIEHPHPRATRQQGFGRRRGPSRQRRARPRPGRPGCRAARAARRSRRPSRSTGLCRGGCRRECGAPIRPRAGRCRAATLATVRWLRRRAALRAPGRESAPRPRPANPGQLVTRTRCTSASRPVRLVRCGSSSASSMPAARARLRCSAADHRRLVVRRPRRRPRRGCRSTTSTLPNPAGALRRQAASSTATRSRTSSGRGVVAEANHDQASASCRHLARVERRDDGLHQRCHGRLLGDGVHAQASLTRRVGGRLAQAHQQPVGGRSARAAAMTPPTGCTP